MIFLSRAQHAVLTKELGIKHILCAIGFSMGAQQVQPLDDRNTRLLTLPLAKYRRTTGRLSFPTMLTSLQFLLSLQIPSDTH